ncbi:alpha-(1,3)-fucosyltransferase C-like [Portunus trituberculatus]|uniref:alpha-(1,3)-fucosyltransferase C-like n=1 Tax=Portunus trituberculatus TaxID=210409 RepID=UPI001E1CCEF0|nr:alpha-(1,3)-fucosyltransferase C-like [Portunus trituberculatus]
MMVVVVVVTGALYFNSTLSFSSLAPIRPKYIPTLKILPLLSPFPTSPHFPRGAVLESRCPSFLTSTPPWKLSGTPDVFQDLPVNATGKDGKKYKIILYWNEIYGNKYFGLGYGHTPFVLAGCRVNTCLATGDRHRYPLEEVDAVMWHLRSNDKSLPKKRYPHTYYVFWMMESASYPFADLRAYRDKFNLTFTYRRDSDAFNPYGQLFLRRHPLPLPAKPINYAKGKTKMAAWFVSNCHTKSRREDFVSRLKAWIKVDVFGGCGKLKCERSNHGQCLEMLEKDYKFYFSFENSLCQDYVTEKFFNAMTVNVIPVVYGFGNYSAIAPPHSYINALDFPTPRKLADFLLYLDGNDTAYNEYFWWKPYYHQTHDWAKKSMAFCELCERLHDGTRKSYDLKKWFIDDSHCMGSYDEAVGRGRARVARSVIVGVCVGIIVASFLVCISCLVYGVFVSSPQQTRLARCEDCVVPVTTNAPSLRQRLRQGG